MEVGEDVKDALIEAAAQLLRYHLGLPEPPPNYLNPNVLLGTVYGRCLRQLIGMQPTPCSPRPAATRSHSSASKSRGYVSRIYDDTGKRQFFCCRLLNSDHD
jgi:hypothetical protein